MKHFDIVLLASAGLVGLTNGHTIGGHDGLSRVRRDTTPQRIGDSCVPAAAPGVWDYCASVSENDYNNFCHWKTKKCTKKFSGCSLNARQLGCDIADLTIDIIKTASCEFINDEEEKKTCERANKITNTLEKSGCKIALKQICNTNNCPENKFAQVCQGINWSGRQWRRSKMLGDMIFQKHFGPKWTALKGLCNPPSSLQPWVNTSTMQNHGLHLKMPYNTHHVPCFYPNVTPYWRAISIWQTGFVCAKPKNKVWNFGKPSSCNFQKW